MAIRWGANGHCFLFEKPVIKTNNPGDSIKDI